MCFEDVNDEHLDSRNHRVQLKLVVETFLKIFYYLRWITVSHEWRPHCHISISLLQVAQRWVLDLIRALDSLRKLPRRCLSRPLLRVLFSHMGCGLYVFHHDDST